MCSRSQVADAYVVGQFGPFSCLTISSPQASARIALATDLDGELLAIV
jgi:hypothetical protein